MSKILRYTSLILFIGILSGLFSSSFLFLLAKVTAVRTETPMLIFGLPFFGFILGILIKRIPPFINRGVPSVLKEIDNDSEKISPFTAPYIFITSLGTHLFGGSAGREGVGILMGASGAHFLPKINPSYKSMRVHMIYAGVAAGFSSMFGTPLAALIFAFEIHSFKEIKKIDLLVTTLLSALVADRVTRYLGPNHHRYDIFFNLNLDSLFSACVVGIVSGVGALVFYFGMKHSSKLLSRFISALEWKLFFSGALVASLIFLLKAQDFAGIGTHMIERSFIQQMHLSDFFLKCLLTVITLAAGFKGGEVTPLFLMGATLSNSALSLLNFRNYSLSSALGMTAIFGAVTSTPIASTIMACELFGWKIGVLALLSCFLAKILTLNKSIYKI